MLAWLRIYSCFVMRGTLLGLIHLSRDKLAGIIDAFNTTSGYLGDTLNIDTIYFDNIEK